MAVAHAGRVQHDPEGRIDTLRRKIAGLNALASDRNATTPEASSARQTAERLQRELTQLLDELPSSEHDDAEPQSYRTPPPSSARWPADTARVRTPRAGGMRRPPIESPEPASNGWLSKMFYVIPPLLVLAGIQAYRIEQDQEGDRAAAEQPARLPAAPQHALRSGTEYCALAEPQLERSFASLPQHWSERLTLLSLAQKGCSGAFVGQLDIAPREHHSKTALFEETRSLIERKLCEEPLTQSALVSHGGVFSFRLQDRVGQLLTEFQIDGGSCDALRPAGSAPRAP